MFLEQSDEHQFIGIHILAEFFECNKEKIDDIEIIKNAIIDGVKISGATLCDIVIKKFEPVGCTIVAVLSESHVSIHTYPEISAAFVDSFTCGTTCDPLKIVTSMAQALGCKKVEHKSISRGIKSED